MPAVDRKDASGGPAELIRRWRSGDFELIVSDGLLDELARVPEYPKLRPYIDTGEAEALPAALRDEAIVRDEPRDPPPLRSRDPDDDYLIALAATSGAALVSGDADLLDLPGELPVFSPQQFLEQLDRAPCSPGQ